jgi:hypothetical protein
MPKLHSAFTVITEEYKLVQARGIVQDDILRDFELFCAWKGISGRSIRGNPVYELFDLVRDPGETTNLASEMPGMVDKLRKSYEEWYNEVVPGA